MSDVRLNPPGPLLEESRQPGVTDPLWPSDAPSGVEPTIYGDRYAGTIERQRHLCLVTADVVGASRSELRETFKTLTEFARHQMKKKPPDPSRPLDPIVASRRVSVTIGLGAVLFTTCDGDDRFGIAALRPSGLKIIPRIEGDVDFDPERAATDLIVLLQSDDIYVNEYMLSVLCYQTGDIRIRTVERGYARPDGREPSGFEDGVTNPRGGSRLSDMNRVVYVTKSDHEPAWCVDGTYLAYRKIRRRLAGFFSLEDPEREAIFGVDARSGARLSRTRQDAHASKMNPKRVGRDLFDSEDRERQILRRPYFFNDGLDSHGCELRGVHHLSFARDLVKQYEWPVLMWQTNPDFPTPGTGMDALYGGGGAANVFAGYYFVPSIDPGSFIGAALVQ
jgi:deferrochelatase/peroxidase EfeB